MNSAMEKITRLRDKAEMLTPPFPWDRPHWKDRGGPVVVLLHGLWRGWRAMQPMERALGNEGFSTLNLPYPSSRLPIATLVNRIRTQIDQSVGKHPLHFVTHSLGGIILRKLLVDGVPWEMGRIVMLAPPNRGSEIVDWAKSHPLVHRALGPAGRELSSDGIPASLAPEIPADIQAAVIMGNRSSVPLFRNLLKSENDGIVSAADGRIEGLRGFSTVHADHTFIQMHPDAIRLSLHFLKTGEWLG
jgi:triacylglycerol lipase